MLVEVSIVSVQKIIITGMESITDDVINFQIQPAGDLYGSDMMYFVAEISMTVTFLDQF